MQQPVGLIRLDSVTARDPRYARTFSEYLGGPYVSARVRLDPAGLEPGELAGLALSHSRFSWVGVERSDAGFTLAQFDQRTGVTSRVALNTPRVWLRAECDVTGGIARFSHSADGSEYTGIGPPHLLGGDPAALRSLCCSLFASSARPGPRRGHADFDAFTITWP